MLQRHAAFASVLLYLLCLACPLNAEQVTVGGKVLGPDKQPVSDCRVLAFCYSPDRQWETAEAVCDAAGVFSFTLDVWDTVGYVNVVAVKQGLALDWGRVNDGEEATLRLGASPVTCWGTVVDSEGNPIAGAKVSVPTLRRPDESDQSRRYLSLREESFLSDTTDEEGRFEIVGLPPKAQVGLTVAAEGWARLMRPPRSISKRGSRLIVRPEATISGRITREGQPVAGAKVSCPSRGLYPYGGRAEAVSAEDGTYKLAQLTFGLYTIAVEPPEGFAGMRIEGIKVKTGAHFTGADLALTRGGVVKGRVTELGTDRPVAGIWVGAERLYQSVTTDEAGAYHMRLPVGKSKVYCLAGGSPLMETVESREREVEVVEGETLTGVDFVVRERQPKMLRGQVLLPDGQPAAGVQIGVVGGYWARPEADSKAITDAEGRFELEEGWGPPLGLPGYPTTPPVLARDVERGLVGLAMVSDSETPVEVRLAAGGYVLAEVVDTEGKPVPDVAVRVYVSVRRTMTSLPTQATSDDQGRLRIGPLPPGVPLMVQPAAAIELLVVDEAWREVGEITLVPGEERELPLLRVNLEGRSIRGWVGDQQQQPIEGAIVFGIGEGQYTDFQEPAYTDERGHFELTGLPMRGKVTIVAAHPMKALFATEQLDPDWGFRPGLLLRPAGSATGEVRDTQGQPLASATVSLSSTLDQMPEELLWRLAELGFMMPTYTDADGKWSAEGLIPGLEYRLYIRDEEHSTYGNAAFTAQAGETVRVEAIRLEGR